MEKNKLPILIFAVAIVLLGFFMWQQNTAAPRFDWDDSRQRNGYKETSDQPYGTKLLHTLLADLFPAKKLSNISQKLSDELPIDSSSAAPKNYVFVGEALFMDSLDTRHLVDFAAAGNQVFISCKTVPYDLMFYLYSPECPDSPWDDLLSDTDTFVSMQLVQPVLAGDSIEKFAVVQRNIPSFYRWHHIPENICCAESKITPLGRLDSQKVNFVEIPVGKGKVLLHANPVVFTNYFLLRPEGRRYASAVLSHLPEGDIFWDAYSRTSEDIGRRQNENRRSGGRRELPEKHALTYILGQKSLAWAWYLLVATAIVWLIFRAKRRQRIIPVLPKNENSSLEFINAIAHLHFRERSFGRLCDQKMRLFLAHLRERYGISIGFDADSQLPLTDAEIFRKISRVSEVQEGQVKEIFRQYAATIQYEPSVEMMTDFHLAVEHFLKNAK